MNAALPVAHHATLDALQASADDFVALRRDIHQHPELGYEEFRTSELVAERLASWGYTVTRGLGGTGVVGQLRRGDGARRLGLRADMDALPIHEATGLPWASTHAGRCTPAATTATPPCCWQRRGTSRSTGAFRAR
jgi:hippurate hydrolase